MEKIGVPKMINLPTKSRAVTIQQFMSSSSFQEIFPQYSMFAHLVLAVSTFTHFKPSHDQRKDGAFINLFMVDNDRMNYLFDPNGKNISAIQKYLISLFGTKDNKGYITYNDITEPIANVLIKNMTFVQHRKTDPNNRFPLAINRPKFTFTSVLGCNVVTDDISQILITSYEKQGVYLYEPYEFSDGYLYQVSEFLIPQQKCFFNTLLDVTKEMNYSKFSQLIRENLNDNIFNVKGRKLNIFCPSNEALQKVLTDKFYSSIESQTGPTIDHGEMIRLLNKTIVYNHIFSTNAFLETTSDIVSGNQTLKSVLGCEVNLSNEFKDVIKNAIYVEMDIAKIWFVNKVLIPDQKCLIQTSVFKSVPSKQVET